MRRRHFIALAGLAALSACNRRRQPTEIVVFRLDPRPLVPQVTQLAVDRHPSGAIIRVTGLPPRQGWFDGALVRVPETEAGVLAYQLHAWAPPYRTRVSTPQSREIVVATFVSTDRLEGIREVRVSGATNTLVARR